LNPDAVTSNLLVIVGFFMPTPANAAFYRLLLFKDVYYYSGLTNPKTNPFFIWNEPYFVLPLD